MSLSQLVEQQLRSLTSAPASVRAADPTGVSVCIELTAIDSVGCSVREMTLSVPQLSGAGFDVVREWAEALSRRITYLLEAIGPVELDPLHAEALIRSTAPQKVPGGVRYYEMVLSGGGQGSFSLQRYETAPAGAGRVAVDLSLIHI